MTRLCINMIVRNEMANLPRCLESLAPHISSAVICDTGSTDGTQQFVSEFLGSRIPVQLKEFPFVNFGQARNDALAWVSESNLDYHYVLLCDADMELMVEDRAAFANLTAPNYSILQKNTISFWNTRLIKHGVPARYHGVTHEYLDVPEMGEHRLNEKWVWFKDHASGSNRPNKSERDIALLQEALKSEPDNARYWFYLAQSLKDAGRIQEAIQAYMMRANMQGWDEEAWYAHLQCARCLLFAGDEDQFLREALSAYDRRPQRAEPLYDLARFYRGKGRLTLAAAFAEMGLKVPYPAAERLFVEHFVYETGLKEELSAALQRSPKGIH